MKCMEKRPKEGVRRGRSEERRVHTSNLLLSLCKYGINVSPFHLILHLKLFGGGREGGKMEEEGGRKEGGSRGEEWMGGIKLT